MRRFKGFTLTELMVALAVIGILVAVVTPAIFKNRPNKNKMMVKKSFYTIEQTINSIINDETLYPDMRNFCGDGADTSTNENEYCAYGFDYQELANYEGYEYEGEYKFAALFKERLNVKNNDEDSADADGTGPEKEDNNTFYPKFFTTDGIYWDLTGTKDAWEPEKDKVGTFADHGEDTAGMGTIVVDVDSSNDESVYCTGENTDCDTYEVQILANGKLRINPDHIRAVNYATINTSIKDE